MDEPAMMHYRVEIQSRGVRSEDEVPPASPREERKRLKKARRPAEVTIYDRKGNPVRRFDFVTTLDAANLHDEIVDDLIRLDVTAFRIKHAIDH